VRSRQDADPVTTWGSDTLGGSEPLLDDGFMSPRLHDMDLFAAIAEQVLDVATVLRVVEHVAHRCRPPLAAPGCRHTVTVQGIGNALERGAVLPQPEDPPDRLGALGVLNNATLLIELVAKRRRAAGDAALQRFLSPAAIYVMVQPASWILEVTGMFFMP
jgi:hypothetical protein